MSGYSIGDTLLIKDPRSWEDRRHLFIVISEPTRDSAGVMLLPSVESLQEWHRDRSCVLVPGDHPFIRHDSQVNYRDAQELSEVNIDRLVELGFARRAEPLEPPVLDKVLEGA